MADFEDLVDDHGEEALQAFAACFGSGAWDSEENRDQAEQYFEDSYHGTYSNKADWCEEFLDDTGGLNEMPDNLRPYFDYESYVRDMELGGDVSFEDGYVFWAF